MSPLDEPALSVKTKNPNIFVEKMALIDSLGFFKRKKNLPEFYNTVQQVAKI
jgi:hypothetical protein